MHIHKHSRGFEYFYKYLGDNLDVFPWTPLKENVKSARISSFSIAAVEASVPKKKQSIGNILTKSQKYSPNVTQNKLSN